MATKAKKVRLSARAKAKVRIRKKVSGSSERPRISVYKSCLHTYAQLISDESQKTVAAASTKDKELAAELTKLKAEDKEGSKTSTKSVLAARAVGLLLARRAAAAGVKRAVLDRNGYVYHGRVKAVADGARAGGLDF